MSFPGMIVCIALAVILTFGVDGAGRRISSAIKDSAAVCVVHP